MRKLLAALLAASAVGLLVVGLVAAATAAPSKSSASASRTSAAHAAANGTLSMALIGDPGKLDPQQTLLQLARQVAEFNYDTLVHQLPGGKIVSGLATKWKVLSLTKVRFTLRSGVTCVDGAKMTATVVKRNLDYVADAKNNSPLLGLYVPENSTTVANNRTRTVTVTFPSANPFPLQGLGSVHMICPKGLANRNSLLNGADGSGPYKLTKVSPGSRYTMQLRKGYRWGPGGSTSAGMPATVVLRVVSNESTAANLLLTGGLNIATVAGPDRARLEKAKLFKTVIVAAPGEIWFNENKGHPAANAAVRKGLVQALQLGQIGKVFTSGRGGPIEAVDPADVHAVLGELGQGQRPGAQLECGAKGAVEPSRLEAPLPDGRRSRLRSRNDPRTGAALGRGRLGDAERHDDAEPPGHAVRQRQLGRRARAARRQRSDAAHLVPLRGDAAERCELRRDQ